jgi:septal ring factor EnvC (AmiA/AmiB activator)
MSSIIEMLEKRILADKSRIDQNQREMKMMERDIADLTIVNEKLKAQIKEAKDAIGKLSATPT